MRYTKIVQVQREKDQKQRIKNYYDILLEKDKDLDKIYNYTRDGDDEV